MNAAGKGWAAALVVAGACKGEPDSGSEGPGTSTTPSGGSTPQVAVELDGVLSASHEGLPLDIEPTNHITVHADGNGEDLVFIVDSGASTTVLTPETASLLGISGSQGVPVSPTGLTVGSYAVSPTLTVILDLGATVAQLEAQGAPHVAGILGAPFLDAHVAVIDYPSSTLYLASTAPADLDGDLDAALTDGGYAAVDAVVDLVKFVTLPSTIDGSAPLNTIVDTGAGGSLVEYAAATRLGLPLEDAATGAATIGGARSTYRTHVGELTLSGSYVLEDRDLLVVDLSSINSQLQAGGLDPVEVLIGGEVLIERDAVLDYVGERLFLRPE